MIPIQTLILIMLIHFLADFGLQTHWQATNKSTDFKALIYHVLVYSFVWFIALLTMFKDPVIISMFTIFIWVTHLITDYFTSKLTKRFFEEKDFHNGFVVVGADQLIHLVTLFTLYLYAK